MATTAQKLFDQIAFLLQEDGTWSNGLWNIPEIIRYTNTVCRDFILKTQILKFVSPVASDAGQRLYDNPEFGMQMDRIAFNNRPLYRTNRYLLDRENPAWRTLQGKPKQYHQDQLPTKTFETDRAPTVNMSGSGYLAIGRGVLRGMLHAATVLSPATTQYGGSINASTIVLTANTANFQPGDVGKQIVVDGAGPDGTPLLTTIASYGTAHQVQLTDAASTTVTNVTVCYASSGFYTVMPPSSGGGVLRYTFGTPAIDATLIHDRPYAGTLRQMFSGTTNFEVIATRLMDPIRDPSDLLRVPDYTVLYIKFGVLAKMLEKEGEAQDLVRARYCRARFSFGVDMFTRLLSAGHDRVPVLGGIGQQ